MSTSVARRSVDVIGRPLDALVRMRPSSPSVVVLIYHRIGGRSPSPVDLDRAAFGEQLDVLAESGRVVDLDAAERILADASADVFPGASSDAASESERAPFVVITFDDGTTDWVDDAMPELARRGLPATFYVSTDHVESGRPFPNDGAPIGWSGLGELKSTGLATIGSHTHTHRVLAGANADVTIDEVDRSVGLIEERLGVPCEHFAYPKAIAPSPAADTVVRRRFATAALAGNRINVAGRTDLHRLGRHGLTVADRLDAFDRKAAGGARLEGWLRENRDAFVARRLQAN